MPSTQKKRKIIFISLIILGISLVLLFTVLPFAVTFFKVIDKFNELGSVNASDSNFHLKDRYVKLIDINTGDTNSYSLNGIKLINFWASWCKPCIEEMPSLQRLRDKRSDIEVVLFSFDSIENQEKIYVQKKWKLPAYFINDTVVFPQPQILPTTYIVKDYRVISRFIGARNWDMEAMNKIIDSLIKK